MEQNSRGAMYWQLSKKKIGSVYIELIRYSISRNDFFWKDFKINLIFMKHRNFFGFELTLAPPR
jgi:hypothetical protein